jgi:hypothetical protein
MYSYRVGGTKLSIVCTLMFNSSDNLVEEVLPSHFICKKTKIRQTVLVGNSTTSKACVLITTT